MPSVAALTAVRRDRAALAGAVMPDLDRRRMPAHIALLTDRKLLADVAAFALAHGCAIAEAGANSANAAQY